MLRIAIPALLLAAGCVMHVHDRHGTEVRVKVPPPPPPRVVLVKGSCPDRDHVWVDGHYDYLGGRYVWINARWVVPPKGTRVFVAGHWRSGVWVVGRWR